MSIFLGDVLATIFVAGGAYFFWYILKYPGFQVGASWTYSGWDASKMGRLPNESVTEPSDCHETCPTDPRWNRAGNLNPQGTRSSPRPTGAKHANTLT
jgi:hypothetical protein